MNSEEFRFQLPGSYGTYTLRRTIQLLKQHEELLFLFIEERCKEILKNLEDTWQIDERIRELLFNGYLQGMVDTCHIIASRIKKGQ